MRAFPPVLVYHKVDGGFELGVNVVSPGAFRRHVEWMVGEGYRGVTLSEALDAPEDSARRVVLTFDDGYAGFARHAAPVLVEAGFRATVFVLSDWIGRKSGWDTGLLGRRYEHLDVGALRELVGEGFEIGSHGASHTDLRPLAPLALLHETAGSRERLEEVCEVQVEAFAYPFGRVTPRVREAVMAAGYRGACGGAMAGCSDDRYRIGRAGVRGMDGVGALRRKVMGGRGAVIERWKDGVAHVACGGTAWIKARAPFIP